MPWQPLATDPLDIDTGVAPARARAIAAALVRRAVPLLVNRHGRPEPLASAAVCHLGGQVVLVTCRHIFDDGVAIGDLGVPRVRTPGVLWLGGAVSRVITHPQRDLALIELLACRTREELLRHWPAVPLAEGQLQRASPPPYYVLAGWPYAQMQRINHTVYAKPLVVFALAAPGDSAIGPSLRVRYARVARRCDGVHVHAPALDGVSGAMLWAVLEDGGADWCVLQPAAVQCAFKHDAYARAEHLDAATALFDHMRRR